MAINHGFVSSEQTRDNLVIKVDATREVVLKATNNLPRARVVALDPADTKNKTIVPLVKTEGGNPVTDGREIPTGILVEDTDATTEDTICNIYEAGQYSKDDVDVTDTGYTIDELQLLLRDKGIHLVDTYPSD